MQLCLCMHARMHVYLRDLERQVHHHPPTTVMTDDLRGSRTPISETSCKASPAPNIIYPNQTHMNPYIHTYIHTHTHMHACRPSRTARATVKWHSHASSKYIQTYIHTHIHTHCMHADHRGRREPRSSGSLTHHPSTCTHTNIHTYIYTHIHTCIHARRPSRTARATVKWPSHSSCK